ncbi:MAG: PLP-dependent transferase [Longimicrobiales bacterium]|nr:PLP-dependent transferase [Longimicrobiales bacterium]
MSGPERGADPGGRGAGREADRSPEAWGASTRSVWAGEEEGAEGATVPPVFYGVTFAYPDLDEWAAVGAGERPGHIYSRNTNPTVALFERKVAALEGADRATAFATGMAAVSSTLFALLEPGARVVSVKDTYGGTNRLFTDFLPAWDVDVTLVETGDHEAMESAIDEGADLVYLETPTNPTLKVLDIGRLARAAKDAGAVAVVDNTFATPINQRPLELGADLVLHSATKFLGGHSDAMGGVLAGDPERVETVFRYREIHGASLDAHSAFLLARGLRTLELRVARQNANALQVARFLAEHDAVADVFYPGLPGHPHHDVAARQMSGFGGVLSFSLVDGGPDAVKRLLSGLRLAHRAASLGSVATLVGPPATTSHVELTPEQRAAAGIPESLVRYSVGIENGDDLVADLAAALEGV